MSEVSYQIRAQFTAADDARDAGLTSPADIVRFDDIQYGPDPIWNVLDVYRPAGAVGALPVLVSFHGGAWVYGDKERYQYFCMALAQQGFAVVNFTYRLAPEFQFPAPLEDANAVFQWIGEHAAQYGFDTDRIFATGDSAGATGIALYACLMQNAAYASRVGIVPPSWLRFRALGLCCGLYTRDVPLDSLPDFAPTEEQAACLEVTSFVTPGFPPCFVMTSNGDFLREEPKSLLPVLDRCGAPYAYQMYGDDAHPLFHVFHCDVRSEAGRTAREDMCAFFRQYL